MPAESAPHERTVMCWPTRPSLYGELLSAAEHAHAEVAATIARFEPVTMIAPPAVAARAAARCGPAVEVVELPTDDSWFRDTGPIYVLSADGTHRVALDWIFNSWGEKYAPWERDAALAAEWARLAGDEVRPVPMVLEGGSIAVDGAGTLLTTTQCLLHPNRNPTLTRTQIEAHLCRELGVDVVLWLPHGLALDEDTDGHVDNVAAFVRPGLVLLQGCADEAEPDHLRADVNRRSIAGAPDADGRAIEIVEVPLLPFAFVGGTRVSVPYLNYYVGNGFVVVPVCGHEADADMVAIIAEHHPDRETIPLDVGAVLAYGGGGIHCITQQVPAVDSTVLS
jgi:agmatine deiminase